MPSTVGRARAAVFRRSVLAALVVGGFAPSTAALASPQWSAPVNVAPGIDVDSASAARTATGGAVIAMGFANPGTMPGLDLATLAPGANSVGSVTQLSAVGAFGAQIVADGQGNAYIYWGQEGSTHSGRVVERSADGSLHPDLGLPAIPERPTIAADSAGNAAAVWGDNYANGTYRLELARKPAGATVFGAPSVVADAVPVPTEDVLGSLHVALADDGSAVVAWPQPPSKGAPDLLHVATITPSGTINQQALSSPGMVVTYPQLVHSAAGIVALWAETTPTYGVGPLRGAIEPTGGSFGAAFDLSGGKGIFTGGSAFGPSAPAIAEAGGYLLAAWFSSRPTTYPCTCGLGDVTVYVEGNIQTGQFSTPATFPTLYGPWWGMPTGAALAADGSALVVGNDGVALRTATNPFDDVQRVSCGPFAGAVLAGVSSGQASFLWRDPGSVETQRPLYLSQTSDSPPQPCPARPPGIVVSPSQVVVGEPVTIDASGLRNAATTNQWSWDLDGDGTYEIPPGPSAVETTSFLTPGDHTVGLKFSYTDARGTGASYTWAIPVHVYRPGTALGRPSTRSGSIHAHLRQRLSAHVLRGQTLRAMLRRGLALRLTSTLGGRVTVTVVAQHHVVGYSGVLLAPRKPKTVRVRLLIRHRTRGTLTLRLAVAGTLGAQTWLVVKAN